MPILIRDKRNIGLRSMGLDTEFLSYLVRLMMSEPFAHLTARQTAIFFSCYMQPEPQSVRALSRYLKVSRPSVSLALSRYGNDVQMPGFDLFYQPSPLPSRETHRRTK
jgi:hypothetical protein